MIGGRHRSTGARRAAATTTLFCTRGNTSNGCAVDLVLLLFAAAFTRLLPSPFLLALTLTSAAATLCFLQATSCAISKGFSGTTNPPKKAFTFWHFGSPPPALLGDLCYLCNHQCSAADRFFRDPRSWAIYVTFATGGSRCGLVVPLCELVCER